MHAVIQLTVFKKKKRIEIYPTNDKIKQVRFTLGSRRKFQTKYLRELDVREEIQEKAEMLFQLRKI